MKIFIAGCGRSGTTLIRDLMGCFEDTYVYVEEAYGEAPFSSFSGIARSERNIVIKRTGECWRTLSDLPPEIELMYCVRHPFDVMTSTHPLTKHLRRFHITADRWVSEYDSWHAFHRVQASRRSFILRYEDLVNEPNRVQEKIVEHFGLKAKYEFDKNPFDIDISISSVEKWKRNAELLAYLRTFPHSFRLLMDQFCKEFDYPLLDGYVDGQVEVNSDLELLNINNPNGLESLDGKSFFWVGGKSTLLNVYSNFNGNVRLTFDAISGPSFEGYVDRHLRITSGDWSAVSVISPGYIELEVSVQVGENEILLEALEEPSVHIMPNGDVRPLILGVGDLQIKKLDQI